MGIFSRRTSTTETIDFLGYTIAIEDMPKKKFINREIAFNCLIRLTQENIKAEEFAKYWDSIESVQKSIEYNAKMGGNAKKALQEISTPAIDFLAEIGNVVNNANDGFTADEVQWIIAQLLSKPNVKLQLEGYPSQIATHKNTIIRHARIKAILVEYKQNLVS